MRTGSKRVFWYSYVRLWREVALWLSLRLCIGFLGVLIPVGTCLSYWIWPCKGMEILQNVSNALQLKILNICHVFSRNYRIDVLLWCCLWRALAWRAVMLGNPSTRLRFILPPKSA